MFDKIKGFFADRQDSRRADDDEYTGTYDDDEPKKPKKWGKKIRSAYQSALGKTKKAINSDWSAFNGAYEDEDGRDIVIITTTRTKVIRRD